MQVRTSNLRFQYKEDTIVVVFFNQSQFIICLPDLLVISIALESTSDPKSFYLANPFTYPPSEAQIMFHLSLGTRYQSAVILQEKRKKKVKQKSNHHSILHMSTATRSIVAIRVWCTKSWPSLRRIPLSSVYLP